MQRYSILWVDDEIDLLKPHIIFLEQRGYDITPVNTADRMLWRCVKTKHFDAVFLDENMPGMSGLEALGLIKANKAQPTSGHDHQKRRGTNNGGGHWL
jgi:CheY-like chemotaxis protein